MAAYLLKRILLIIPTLFGIMLISFAIIQFAPGGPVDRIIAQLTGRDSSIVSRIGGGGNDALSSNNSQAQLGQGAADAVTSKYRGAQGLDPEFIKSLEKQFGFDKPAYERFFIMMKSYLTFDFGKSYFRDVSVLQLIKEKLPVSISLGLWMMIISYMISIPLGIRKAVHDGEPFDSWSSTVLVVAYAIPGFLFAVLLLILFAGALLIETIFSLDGLGLLSFESIEKRDYPVIFATLWIFSLMGLVLNIISDFAYTLVDPRIDFESREV
jgi:microcin C transport system permease protein